MPCMRICAMRDGEVLDDAVVLYFQGPHSYTGEDVLELQAHGNPSLLNAILRECRRLGARDARAGEFTERAFLNDKLDLAQAEAVADLISAQSETAARAARRSLDGVFSQTLRCRFRTAGACPRVCRSGAGFSR